MNLDQYRKISDRAELDQLPVNSIVVEYLDRWNEVAGWQRTWFENGLGTHDFEVGWANFDDGERHTSAEIDMPVYLIWNPEEHHA